MIDLWGMEPRTPSTPHCHWAAWLLFPLLLACGGPATSQAEADPPTTTSDTPPTIPPPDGLQEMKYPDGSVRMRGHLAGGKRDGMWTAFFPNGTIQSKGVYQNGVRHGSAEVFHEGGMPYYTGQYHRDNPSGKWFFYDSTGTLHRTVVYDTLGNILENR